MSKHFFGTVLIFWARQKLTVEERDNNVFQKHFSFFWHWTAHPSTGSDWRSMQKYLIFMREPQGARQVYSAKGDHELGSAWEEKEMSLQSNPRDLTIQVLFIPALWPYLTLKRHLNPISGEQSNPSHPARSHWPCWMTACRWWHSLVHFPCRGWILSVTGENRQVHQTAIFCNPLQLTCLEGTICLFIMEKVIHSCSTGILLHMN